MVAMTPISPKILGKGDKVSLRGKVKYFADGSFWECDFTGDTFEVDYTSPDRCGLLTPGLHDGEIYVFYSNLEGKIFRPTLSSKKRYFLGKALTRFKAWLKYRWMMGFAISLVKGYVFGVSGFWPIRKFKDGITFFEFDINLDLFKDDHNPKFRMMLTVVNLKLIELEVYKASK